VRRPRLQGNLDVVRRWSQGNIIVPRRRGARLVRLVAWKAVCDVAKELVVLPFEGNLIVTVPTAPG
jgi:hypothetical protein